MQPETKEFLCSYYHRGEQWCLRLHAYDWSDAEARCRKLGVNLDGELLAVVPVKAGWFAKMLCACRNFLRLL